MNTQEFKQMLELKRLELDAKYPKQDHWNRHQYKKQGRMPNRPRPPKKQEIANLPLPYLSNWDSSYRSRMVRCRSAFPFTLPESLLDAAFMTFEQAITKLVFHLLK